LGRACAWQDDGQENQYGQRKARARPQKGGKPKLLKRTATALAPPTKAEKKNAASVT
jgi:hypothetical protein